MKDDPDNSIENKLIENEIKKAFERLTTGIHPEPFNTEDYNQACIEILITDLVRMISNCKILGCFIWEDKSGIKIIKCNNRFIFENIKLYIKNHSFIKDIYSGFVFSRFNPYEDLFIRNLNEILALGIGEYLNSDSGFHHNYDDHDLVKFCTIFNHFIDNIKKEANSREFKIALNLYQDQLERKL